LPDADDGQDMNDGVENVISEHVELIEVVIQCQGKKHDMACVDAQDAFSDERKIGDVADGWVLDDKGNIVEMEFAA